MDVSVVMRGDDVPGFWKISDTRGMHNQPLQENDMRSDTTSWSCSGKEGVFEAELSVAEQMCKHSTTVSRRFSTAVKCSFPIRDNAPRPITLPK